MIELNYFNSMNFEVINLDIRIVKRCSDGFQAAVIEKETKMSIFKKSVV